MTSQISIVQLFLPAVKVRLTKYNKLIIITKREAMNWLYLDQVGCGADNYFAKC